jgi:DNA-binding LacI/PurR family transcriptional regulator
MGVCVRFDSQMNSLDTEPQTAKYLKLAEMLRRQLSDGLLKPGDQLPSFVELRQRHSVSRGTVEKVHSLLERDGLIVREQGRGVFVAGAPARIRHGVIAVTGGGFFEASLSLFWAHLMSGIQEAALENKLQLLLINKHVDPDVWSRVDGLLFSENEEDLEPFLKLVPPRVPAVSVLQPTEAVCCVLANDLQGSYDLTRHLLSLGHRRIGYIVAGYHHLVENRLTGYRNALREFGIEPHLAWVRQMKPRTIVDDSKSEFITQGRLTVEKWLKSDWDSSRCTAVIAQNDPAAIGAIEAFQFSGLTVPGDVSVAGYDGIESFDYFSPQLTTVTVPVKQIGAKAVELLLKLSNTKGDIKNVVLPSLLAIGSSTGAAPSL